MERVLSIHLSRHLGSRIAICGWVHAIRRLGGVAFLIVRDGWGLAQTVCDPAETSGLGPETVVRVVGDIVAAPQAPQGAELHAPSIEIVAPAEPPAIPLGRSALGASLPVLLDQAAVLNRHPTRRALLRLGAGAMAGFRATLGAAGFTEVQTPKILGGSSEGGANVFALDYFGTPACLAQSPQLYKQMLVGVFERVFEVGPVFRAEPHDSIRHLSQYVSLDLEMGFIESHRTVMDLLRTVLAGMLAELRRACAEELALLGVALPEVPAQIPTVHFTEAKELAHRATGVDERAEPDLSPAEERALGAWARAERGSEFLFVEGYPLRKRPFYTHPEPGRPAYSNSFDLLFRGLELVTGGQRLHRHADYQAAISRCGIAPGPLAHYLEAFRHGMPPHGGCAIGLERLIMQITGAPNIRLATAFPRDRARLAP